MTEQEALRKAIEYHQANQLQEAEKLYRAILSKVPDHPDANHNLGVLAMQVNRPDVALPLFEKALKTNPEHPQFQRSFADARAKLSPSPTANQQDMDKQLTALLSQQKYEAALALAKEAVNKNPNYTFGWKVIGPMMAMFKDYDHALPALQKALALDPQDAETHYNLGNVLKSLGRLDEATTSYRETIRLMPDYVNAHYNLGNVLNSLGRLDEAESSYRETIRLKPDYADAYYNLGNVLNNLGKMNEAANSYHETIRLKPDYAQAHRALSLLLKYSASTPHLLQLENLYAKVHNIADKYHLGFALAKAYDDMKAYDQSFHYLEEANRLKHEASGYDIKNDEMFFAAVQKLFSYPEIIKPDAPVDKRAIFIVGMPRSGTSLAEQILSCHSDVYGCGELSYVEDAWNKHVGTEHSQKDFSLSEALGNVYREYMQQLLKRFDFSEPVFTDKMPMNFRFVGAILEAFPQAKIIHMKRDAMAVCWSNYQTCFPDKTLEYAFSLKTIAQYYKFYEAMMAYWEKRYPNTIYTLEYEKLTEDQEGETRKLLEFCELRWEDSVLKPEENRRAVNTASNQQVRKKVYTGSSQAWHKYEKHLQELKHYMNNR